MKILHITFSLINSGKGNWKQVLCSPFTVCLPYPISKTRCGTLWRTRVQVSLQWDKNRWYGKRKKGLGDNFLL